MTDEVKTKPAPIVKAEGKFIVFGKLRRDTMILGVETSSTAATDAAEAAVRLGRAEETFVVAATAHFSAQGIAWDNVDTGIKNVPASIGTLNPESDTKESLHEPKTETTSIREQRELAAENAAKGADLGDADRKRAEAQGKTDA